MVERRKACRREGEVEVDVLDRFGNCDARLALLCCAFPMRPSAARWAGNGARERHVRAS